MRLREARTADISALARLGRESFVAKFGHLYKDADLSAFLSRAYCEEVIADDLDDPIRLYRLAETKGGLAGYCKLGLVCGWPDMARGRNVIELKQLYTAPDMTGQGIGAALMDWALDEAQERGADEIQLSVWSGNHGAQRFYARYGFSKVGDTHFMVGNHRDEEYLFALLL